MAWSPKAFFIPRNNLAVCYLKAGRVDEAIALYEKVLADRMRVLGADHPDTLASRDNLETAMRAREAGNVSARVPQKKAPPSSGKWLCP